MMDWRIFYSDGSTFSSEDGTPHEAPIDGVVCIVYPDEMVGRVIMHGWDWYYWVDEVDPWVSPDGMENEEITQWWGSDKSGVDDRKRNGLSIKFVKQGRNATNTRFTFIMGMADQDPDVPPKSGKRAKERPS